MRIMPPWIVAALIGGISFVAVTTLIEWSLDRPLGNPGAGILATLAAGLGAALTGKHGRGERRQAERSATDHQHGN
jgi:hypothetical protein